MFGWLTTLLDKWRWTRLGKFTADFETTTDFDDCRVWAFACCDVDDPAFVVYGNDIEGFMEWCAAVDDSVVWFHNLKFDGEFIYNHLLDTGWEWVAWDDFKNAQPQSFSTLISDKGQHYAAKLKFTKNHVIELRDSLKVISLPVRDIPKAFGLEDDVKLEIDYKAKREPGHVLTDEEKAYIREDVVIVAKAMKQLLDGGMNKLTAGSNALAHYKETVGGHRKFRKLFPVPDYDEEVRKAYKGGFTYADPRFTGRDVGSGISFDVNSLYPSVMAYKMLPYGDPKTFEGEYVRDAKYPLFVQAVKIDCKLKDGHIPCIQVKEGAYSDRFSPTEYISDTKGPVVRYLTNVDLELIREQYHIFDIEYLQGWKFKASDKLFREFIEEANAAKVEAARTGNAGKRFMEKIKMNSSYGKLGTNPVCVSCKPVKRDGRVYYEHLPEERREPVYIAGACFITAYARSQTIRAAQANYERFLYADTDSIYLKGTEPPNGIDVDDYRLGAWKHEHTFQRFKALRAKTYVFEEDGELVIHCAGLPKRCYDYVPEPGEEVPEDCLIKVTFDNFEIGAKYWGKLFNAHVNGGIVLYNRFFTIR